MDARCVYSLGRRVVLVNVSRPRWIVMDRRILGAQNEQTTDVLKIFSYEDVFLLYHCTNKYTWVTKKTIRHVFIFLSTLHYTQSNRVYEATGARVNWALAKYTAKEQYTQLASKVCPACNFLHRRQFLYKYCLARQTRSRGGLVVLAEFGGVPRETAAPLSRRRYFTCDSGHNSSRAITCGIWLKFQIHF